MRQGLTIVGAFVGAYFGNPQLGMAIGAAIGGLVDPERIKNPTLGEIGQQTAAEGVPISLYAGTTGGAGNLIYCSDPDVIEGEYSSGKGGPQVQEPDRIFRTFLIMVGQSLFTAPGNRTSRLRLVKLWEAEKLVYDVSPESTILEESEAYAEENALEFYPGDEDQLPDPAVEAIEGVGNVSAYRGRAYFRMRKDCTDYRGAVPPFRFEVAVEADTELAPGLITDTDLYNADLSLGTSPWVSFSPTVIAASDDGEWIAGGKASGTRLQILRLVEGVYTKVADPATLPTGSVTAISWSSGGNLLAVRTSGAERFIVYARSGETFTPLPAPATIPNGSGSAIALSPDGLRLAVGRSASPYLYHYWIVNGELQEPEQVTSVAAAPTHFRYSADSTALAISAGNYVLIYDTHSSDETPQVGVQNWLGGPGFVAGMHWGYGGAYVVTVSSNFVSGNLISVYPYNAAEIPGSRLGARLAYAATQPPTASLASAMNAEGTQLAVGLQNSVGQVGLYVYDMASDGTLTVSATQPDIGAAGTAQAVSYTNGPAISLVEAGTATLDQIVLATGRRCKMASTLFDVANLTTDSVRGVVINYPGYTGQDFLNGLRWAFLLDGTDYDGQIHFPKRGGPTQFALTDDDLVDEQDDSEQTETLRNGDDRRPAAIRRPLKLNLMFPNRTVGYQFTKATSPNYGDRGDAVSEVTLQVPVVLNDTDEAPQLADKLEKTSRADAEGEIVRIVHEGVGAELTAGDVGTLTDRGVTRRVRVETYRSGAGKKRLLLRVDRPHSVTSQVSQQAVPAPPSPPPSLIGETQFVVLNIPGIDDADDRLGIRIGVQGPAGKAWSGTLVRLSTDGGSTWSNLAQIRQRAQLGVLLSEITGASEFYPDNTNTLRVAMIDDRELETLTEAEWLSEGNAAAIAYTDGTAELVQPRDAQDDGDNEWTLTRLQRGRLATEANAHGIGAKFVMLEGTVFVPLPSSLIGQDVLLQFVSLGRSSEAAPTYGFTWDPVASQTEFPAANLLLERDGDTITATAIPRHRFGSELNPIASANFIGYRFTATDGSNTATVDTGATDPDTDFDVTGWASPVTVTVALLNRYTGAGPTISEDIA